MSKTPMLEGWLSRDKEGRYQNYVLFWPSPHMRPDGAYEGDGGVERAWSLSEWQEVYGDFPPPKRGQGFPVSIEL